MSEQFDTCQRIKKYDGGVVTRALMEDALDYFISIEPDPEKDIDYEAYMAGFSNDECFMKAHLVLRRFGEEISPRTLEKMQAVFYSITGSPKYLNSSSRCVIARAYLARAWNGIGDWRR